MSETTENPLKRNGAPDQSGGVSKGRSFSLLGGLRALLVGVMLTGSAASATAQDRPQGPDSDSDADKAKAALVEGSEEEGAQESEEPEISGDGDEARLRFLQKIQDGRLTSLDCEIIIRCLKKRAKELSQKKYPDALGDGHFKSMFDEPTKEERENESVIRAALGIKFQLRDGKIPSSDELRDFARSLSGLLPDGELFILLERGKFPEGSQPDAPEISVEDIERTLKVLEEYFKLVEKRSKQKGSDSSSPPSDQAPLSEDEVDDQE